MGGWRDGWMERGEVTIGRDQCEQETSSALCRCAAGTGTAFSFTAPPTKYNNDELDLINSWSHSRSRRAWWLSFCTYQWQQKTFLCYICSTWKIKQNSRNNTQGSSCWLSVGEFLSISTINDWVQRLVIGGAFVPTHPSLDFVKRHLYDHTVLVACLKNMGVNSLNKQQHSSWVMNNMATWHFTARNCEGLELHPWETKYRLRQSICCWPGINWGSPIRECRVPEHRFSNVLLP